MGWAIQSETIRLSSGVDSAPVMEIRHAQTWKYSPRWLLSVNGSRKQFPRNNGLQPILICLRGADVEVKQVLMQS